uniref:pelargonidin 3-O-(6-caffeoylglucoside) 5-O-(6-O-malonylglucoside) 4'''-malonyltransferase-like n=1 Tax=Erigeron canadensis TaxID=72917 RepID=UPI001CB9C73D|nr:pelargonidin 3-O-(6-caffeoylglucoside) 5-O-(6-O-malonylglucoside) 4'''-malonyltransferase-like [Erigeron canadensis]
MEMKIEKQPSKIIKPFVPTLSSHYKLGFIEEVVSLIYVRIVLFFPSNTDHNDTKFVARLEKSLEKILTRFYPVAGRYVKETNIIDCNDEGVEFIDAQINIKLDDFLDSKDNDKFIDEFIPSKFGLGFDMHNDSSLITIQVTTFECGGVAIGISGSHLLFDASTLCTFINEWALMNREENETEFTAYGFGSSSVFPAHGFHPFPVVSDDMLSKYTRKKLSFNASLISNLKEKAKNSIHKWSKPINLREKMASLIPKSSCGNIFGVLLQEVGTTKTFEELADLLSDFVRKSINEYSKTYHDNEEGVTMVLNSFLQLYKINPESTNLIILTSWCKFPFYEADFGFGKPIWVAPGTIPLEKSVYLIDDVQGNGVEAYVFLKVEEVPKFEEALNRVNTLLFA